MVGTLDGSGSSEGSAGPGATGFVEGTWPGVKGTRGASSPSAGRLAGELSGNNSGGITAGPSGKTGASLPGGSTLPGSKSGWNADLSGRGPSSPGSGGSTPRPGSAMTPPNSKHIKRPNFTPACYRKTTKDASLEIRLRRATSAKLDPATVRALVMPAGTPPASLLRTPWSRSTSAT